MCTLCRLSALRTKRFICLYRADSKGDGVDADGGAFGDGLSRSSDVGAGEGDVGKMNA
jgi:hypothetical protein